MLENGQLGGPIGSETLPVDADSGFVDFRSRLQIIDDARKHALRGFAGLDGRLAGTGRVDADEADSVGQNGAKIFREVFLAAIEAADGNHYWNWASGIF